MEKVKVSVIVPVYNVEKYIERCLTSLLSQSLDNYEIIVVNDGTPDASMSYAVRLQEKNNKIIICNRVNGGLSAARNTGIQHAKGEYLLFCDSDDAIEKDSLQLLYNEAKLKKLDMLLFDAKTIYEEGIPEYTQQDPYIRVGINPNILSGIDMLKELVEKRLYFASACMYLIKREVISSCNLSFYEGIIHEDELFTPIALALSKRVEHRNWLCYKRFVREGSIMTSTDYGKRMESLAIVVENLMIFYDKVLRTDDSKEIFRKIIISHLRELLGKISSMKEPSDMSKHIQKSIREILKQKHWKLGVEFEIYLIYIKLKKGLRC